MSDIQNNGEIIAHLPGGIEVRTAHGADGKFTSGSTGAAGAAKSASVHAGKENTAEAHQKAGDLHHKAAVEAKRAGLAVEARNHSVRGKEHDKIARKLRKAETANKELSHGAKRLASGQ